MAEIELDRREAANGELPPVCIYCGAPAVTYRSKIFLGTTPFTYFWFHMPRVALPVCAGHRSYTLWRSLILVPVVIAFFTLLSLLAELSGKEPIAGPLAALVPFKAVFVGLVFVMFVALVGTILFVFYTDIRCTRLTTVTITLAPVADRFVDACYAADDETIAEVLPVDSGPLAGRRRSPHRTSSVRPRGRGGWWIILGVGALLAGCGGLAGLFWLVGWRGGGETLVLSNPRYTRGPGLIQSIQVEYRFRSDGPNVGATYVFIVRPAEGQPQQRVYLGRELRQSGTLQIDLQRLPFGRPVLGGGPAGPFEVVVEVEPAQPGGPRQRVSNVLTLR